MGGGAAMRAASKVAGFSVNGGIRSTTSVPLTEKAVNIAARKPSKSITSISSSTTTEDAKSAILHDSHNGKIDSASFVKRSWAIDDWEFAGDEEELIIDSMNPMPRVIFGSVPTLEEAKEATADLKEALEKEYFSSSNTIGCKKSSTFVPVSTPSVPLNSETKAYVNSESVVAHSSVPKPVFHAFSLLNESPEVQGVVASLASDKNVWDAIMKNDMVMEFIKSQQTSGMDMGIQHALADNEFHEAQKSSKNDNGAEEKDSEGSGNGFMGSIINKVKAKVEVMVSNLTELLQNIFGGPAAAENISSEANGSGSETIMNRTIGSSLMALAVLAVMVVLLKRV